MTLDELLLDDLDFLATDSGSSVIYTPADTDIAPFQIDAILSGAYQDEFETGNVKLNRDCRLLHSDLEEHGVSVPVEQVRGASADTVTLTGPGGASEEWVVTGKRYDYGLWVLTISRDQRITS